MILLLTLWAVCVSAETTTVMVYMCGGDLESWSQEATADIGEMQKSGLTPEELNLIIIAGGSLHGSNLFSADQANLYQLTAKAHGDGLNLTQIDAWENASMGAQETLNRFLCWCAENTDSDRYALIIWDHGAGPMEGMCFDETRGMEPLSLSEFDNALRESPFALEKRLSWIGIDACFMASVETALTCAPYADYLIASQELEPASGWNYSFLGKMRADMSSADIGRLIIDSYADPEEHHLMLTLSCIDLSKIATVQEKMGDFFSSLGTKLIADTFSRISNARQSAKSFGRATARADYDLVDLYDLSIQYADILPDEVAALQDSIREAVEYQKGNQNHAFGLSLYSPYYNQNDFSRKWRKTYSDLSFSSEYSRYLNRYAGIWLGEQLADWHKLSYQAQEYSSDTKSQSVEMVLTEDQLTHFASAKVVILQGTDVDDTYRKIFESENLKPEENALCYTYDYSALYVVDDKGKIITDPIVFEYIDGYYILFASLNDISNWEQTQRNLENTVMGTDNKMINHVAVLVRGHKVSEDGIDLLDIDCFSVLPLLSNTELENLNWNNILSILETHGVDVIQWPYLDFNYFNASSRLTRNEDNSILPFDEWKLSASAPGPVYFDPEGNLITKPYEYFGTDLQQLGVVDQRKEWQFRFIRNPEIDASLYAQFIVTDTQGNKAASELIPLKTPGHEIIADIPKNEIVYSDSDMGIEVTLTDIKMIRSSEPNRSGLYMTFYGKNTSDRNYTFSAMEGPDAIRRYKQEAADKYNQTNFQINAHTETKNHLFFRIETLHLNEDRCLENLLFTPIVMAITSKKIDQHFGETITYDVNIDCSSMIKEQDDLPQSDEKESDSEAELILVDLPEALRSLDRNLVIKIPDSVQALLQEHSIQKTDVLFLRPIEDSDRRYIWEGLYLPELQWYETRTVGFTFCGVMLAPDGKPSILTYYLQDDNDALKMKLIDYSWYSGRKGYLFSDAVVTTDFIEGLLHVDLEYQKLENEQFLDPVSYYKNRILTVDYLDSKGYWDLNDSGEYFEISAPFTGESPHLSMRQVDEENLMIYIQWTLENGEFAGVICPYLNAIENGEKAAWLCMRCGRENLGDYCTACGMGKREWSCSSCGKINVANKCERCGKLKMDSLLDTAAKYVQEKDYENAIPFLLLTLHNKKAYSAEWLGYICYQGLGVQADLSKALFYFRIGDRKGSSFSWYYMAHIYDKLKNYSMAAQYYQKAAESGYTDEYIRLGDLYRDPAYGIEDQNAALAAYQEAAKTGSVSANEWCGYYYYEGIATDRNEAVALSYFQAAAQGGSAYAQLMFGEISRKAGLFSDALKAYQAAAEGGRQDALSYLGDMYSQEKYGILEYKKAFEAYTTAADSGDAYCAYRLGQMYQDEAYGQLNGVLAEKYLLFAASSWTEDKIYYVYYELGRLYTNDQLGKYDIKRGVKNLVLAADYGIEGAAEALSKVKMIATDPDAEVDSFDPLIRMPEAIQGKTLLMQFPKEEFFNISHVQVFLLGKVEDDPNLFRLYASIEDDILTSPGFSTVFYHGLLLAPESSDQPISLFKYSMQQGRAESWNAVAMLGPKKTETRQIQIKTMTKLYIWMDADEGKSVLYDEDDLITGLNNYDENSVVLFEHFILRFEDLGNGIYSDFELLDHNAENKVSYEGKYPVLRWYPAEQFDPIVAFRFTRHDGSRFTVMKPYQDLI